MQALREWFEVASPARKLFILLAVLGIVSVLIHGVAIKPRLDRMKALRAELRQLEHVHDAQAHDRVEKEALAAEVANLRRMYFRLGGNLGLPMSGAEVLSDISDAAAQAGVTLLLWKPRTDLSEPDKQVYKTSSRLEIEANFHGLISFLGELAELPKALAVETFSISAKPGGQSSKTIHVSLDLFGYESLAAEERG